MVVSVDFETYYSAQYSVKRMDPWAYVNHPEFDPYLVSIVSDNGQEFCGNPRDFQWSSIQDETWVSHNRGFDETVFYRAVELGLWEGASPKEWHCTADLATFIGLPRALAKVVPLLYGEEVSKDIRGYMSGRKWEKLSDEKRQELIAYCLQDSRHALRIWLDHQHKWPWLERWLSWHTTRMGRRGIPVNKPRMEKDLADLKRVNWEAQRQIPWTMEDDEGDAGKPLSSAQFAMHCRKHGIEPPPSTAMHSPECDAWIEKHGETDKSVCVNVLKAMRVFRRSNTLLSKLENMIQGVKPEGWMAYSLKYGGAHTLRDSGDGGVNTQNLSRKEIVLEVTLEDGERVAVAVDLRGMIEAPEGYVFVSSDLSQIEPRCLRWLVNDERILELLRQGLDPYEAYARSTLGYADPRPLKDVDPELRHVCKVSELSLGYGVGWQRVQITLGQDGIQLTDAQAQKIVATYRAKNANIQQLGQRLLAGMRSSHGSSYKVQLPSGRYLNYWNVKNLTTGLTAQVTKYTGLQETGWFGGKLVENLVQAMARDVFMECVYRVEGLHNLPVLMRVHDEVLVLSKEEDAQKNLQTVLHCMSTAPEWAPGLPVAAEAKIITRYAK